MDATNVNENEPPRETAELERTRRLARRRMAIVSFTLLVLQSGALYSALLFSDDRMAIAQAFTASWAVLTGSQATLVTIILVYLGVSVSERIWAA